MIERGEKKSQTLWKVQNIIQTISLTLKDIVTTRTLGRIYIFLPVV
jgi:hypothetical protein